MEAKIGLMMLPIFDCQCLIISAYKPLFFALVCLLIPVILATQKGRILGQPRQKVSETPSLPVTRHGLMYLSAQL
jgi:hypothetical protein